MDFHSISSEKLKENIGSREGVGGGRVNENF